MKQERCGDEDKKEPLENGDAGNDDRILDEQPQGRIGQKYPKQAEDRIDSHNLEDLTIFLCAKKCAHHNALSMKSS